MYHFTADIISRSKGHSVVASVAYHSAAKMVDERTGKTWDYRNKAEEVVHSEILIPDNAPKWVQDIAKAQHFDKHAASEMLWNLVEQREKRKDAQLSRKLEFALPIELSKEQNVALARRFIKEVFVNKGMVADFSFHNIMGNPHIHVNLTMRELTEDGFGNKIREWNREEKFKEWRAEWAVYQNHALERAGFDKRVDHRSNKDRGIDLIPSVHRGRTDYMAKRGMATRKAIETEAIHAKNTQKVKDKPMVILDKISQENVTFSGEKVVSEVARFIPVAGLSEENKKKLFDGLTPENIEKLLKTVTDKEVVFSERDIAKEVNLRTEDREAFLKVLAQIKASSELIYLGVGDDGRDRYTTRNCFEREAKMQDQIDVMAYRMQHLVKEWNYEKALTRYELKTQIENPEFKGLSSEQKAAIQHVLFTGDVAVLVGKAGTGKTTVLEPCVDAFQQAGFEVKGIALSGVATQTLQRSLNKPCETIAAFTTRLEKNGDSRLDKNSVLIVDEASMVGSEDMAKIVDAVQKAQAKLVLVGDHGQLYGVLGGAPLRAIAERVGFTELTEVYRQKEDWQREASQLFAQGNVYQGLKSYADRGFIHFEKNDESARSQLVNDWLANSANASEKLIIAHQNKHVNALNEAIRQARIEKGELTQSYQLLMKHGNLDIAVGDRVLFAEKTILGHERIERNQFATITGLEVNESGSVRKVTFQLDGKMEKPVTVDSKILSTSVQLKYGYAATVHKAQGATIPHVYTYLSGYWDRNLTYVANTRHQISNNLYVNQSEFKDLNQLALRCSRKAIKDSVLDYPVAFAERRGFDVEKLKGFKQHVIRKIEEKAHPWLEAFQKALFPVFCYTKKEKERLAEQGETYRDIQITRGEQRENVTLIALWEDKHREVGKAWEKVKQEAQSLGHWDMETKQPILELMKDSEVYLNALKVTQERNLLAHKILSQKEIYEPILKDLGKDKVILEPQQQGYQLFEAIQAYKQNAEGLFKFKAAYEIKHLLENNISLYPQFLEAKLSNSTLRYETIQYKLYQKLSSVKAEDKKVIEDLIQYCEFNQLTRNAWHEHFTQQKKDKTLENALNLQAQRDKLAHKIYHLREKYEPYWDMAQIKMEVLEKQQRIHAESLEQVNYYRQKRSQLINQLSFVHGSSKQAFFDWRKDWEQLIQESKDFSKTAKDYLIEITDYKRDIKLTQQLDKVLGIQVKKTSFKAITGKQNIPDYAYSIKDIESMLTAQAQSWAESILGEPNRSNSNAQQLSFGSRKGSLKVTLTGARQGSWYDFQTGQGGGMLSLTQYVDGVDFKEALKRAKNFLGIQENDISNANKIQNKLDIQSGIQITPLAKEINTQFTDKQLKSIATAQKIAAESKSIKGTVAQDYLKNRGILDIDSSQLTFTHVYNKSTDKMYPALIAMAYNEQNATLNQKTVQGIQIIYLENGEKAKIDVSKRTIGTIKGAGVCVQRGRNDIIAIAEGAETALSVAQSNKNLTVYASLGISNMATLNLPEFENKPDILICSDNDGKDSASQKMINKAVEAWALKEYTVYVAQPNLMTGMDKCDFNDVLQQSGVEAVKSQIRNAELAQTPITLETMVNELLGKQVDKSPAKTFTELFDSLEQKTLVTEKTHPVYKDLNWEQTFNSAKKQLEQSMPQTMSVKEPRGIYWLHFCAERMADDLMHIRNHHLREPTYHDVLMTEKRSQFEWDTFEQVMQSQILQRKGRPLDDGLKNSGYLNADRRAALVGKEFEMHYLKTGEWLLYSHTNELTEKILPMLYENMKIELANEKTDEHHKSKIYLTNRFKERYGVLPNAQEASGINKQATQFVEVKAELEKEQLQKPWLKQDPQSIEYQAQQRASFCNKYSFNSDAERYRIESRSHYREKQERLNAYYEQLEVKTIRTINPNYKPMRDPSFGMDRDDGIGF